MTTPCAPTANKLGRIEMAIAPSDPNVMYAEVQSIDPQPNCGALQALGATTAAAASSACGARRTAERRWTQVADHTTMSFLEGTTTAGPCGEDTPQMWYDMGLAVDPNNPDAFFLDAIDIWKSTDGGQTLTDISCGYYAGLNPIGSPVHVDNHVLAYQPGSSTNLLAGSDGGIYVSNNAVNAPQGTLDRRHQPADVQGRQPHDEHDRVLRRRHQRELRDVANPFIVAGAQDNGSSYGQFGPGATCPVTRLPVVAADRRRRLLRAHRAQAGSARVHGEPERRAAALDDRPRRPVPVRGRRLGRGPLSFIFPYEIDKFACPTATCDHMIAGSNRVWESINGADSWYPNSPDLTKGTLADRSYINQLTTRRRRTATRSSARTTATCSTASASAPGRRTPPPGST